MGYIHGEISNPFFIPSSKENLWKKYKLAIARTQQYKNVFTSTLFTCS